MTAIENYKSTSELIAMKNLHDGNYPPYSDASEEERETILRFVKVSKKQQELSLLLLFVESSLELERSLASSSAQDHLLRELSV